MYTLKPLAAIHPQHLEAHKKGCLWREALSLSNSEQGVQKKILRLTGRTYRNSP